MKKNDTLLLLITSTLSIISGQSYAVQFNTNFFAGKSNQADLSQFYTTSDLPPGQYNVDLYLNNEWKGRFDIVVKNNSQDLYLKGEDLLRLGLKLDDKESIDPQQQMPIDKFLHGGKATLNTSVLTVHLSVPQAYVKNELKGYIDPAHWDEGIPGIMLSYNSNYYHTQNKHSADNKQDDDNAYVALNSGLNLLGWQLRDQSTYLYNDASGSKWTNNTRYLQRGIAMLNSEVRLGDSYTSSDLFDSFRFRGISLHTDMRMYPDAYQGFAPVIRGVAQTNALIKVSQNGTVIYQTNVPPGEFAIDNILPTGSGGDLSVDVVEANGSVNHFIVPFASVPNMLKEGMTKYDLSLGKTRLTDTAYHPEFLQASYQYGFNNLLTGYTGTIVSENYQSLLIGTGLNLPIGAVSLDISQSNAKFQQGQTMRGLSYKLSYSKFMPQTSTNFALAAYRYSTPNYLSFTDAISMHDWLNQGYESQSFSRQKNTFNININQNMGGNLGSFFLSGTLRDYWGQAGKNKEYQVGYSNVIGKINYSLSASRVRYVTNDQHSREEQRYYLSISVPLDMFDNPAYLTSSIATSGSHYDNSNLGISGNSGPSSRLNYNLNVANQHKGATTGSANLSYKTPFSTLSGSYSESSDYRQAGFGATGSIVAYQGGVLTSNQIGDTFAIIDAPGAANAAINGNRNIVTNSSGKVLVPYLSPYRQNAIMLDTSDMPEGAAELQGNIRDVAPYAGAITYLGFKTDQRKTFIFYSSLPNGIPLPFGTEVVNRAGQHVGYVGQGSMVFIQAETLPDAVEVKLNREDKQTCIISPLKPGLGAAANPCRLP